MKVLHLITRLDPGGSAEAVLLSCQHLAARGWSVKLATGPGQNGAGRRRRGPRVLSILIPSLRRDPAPLADLRALIQLIRLLRRERPEILHTHSAKAGILGRWAGAMARVPYLVHTPHGHLLYGYVGRLKSWLYLMAERATGPLTHRLVAVTEGERRESVAHGIGRPEQWCVIPGGVDLAGLGEWPAPGGREGAPLRIGVVARLEPVKGVDLLVRAAARLRKRRGSFHILVWGEGSQRGELERLAAREGVADRFEFVGCRQEVATFLRSLDLYVQPSRNEAMGRALVMAHALGLPVVATRVCGIPDVVRDGETGHLVAPDDPEALAVALERFIAEPALCRRLGDRARRWIASPDETGYPRFSIEAMIWRLESLYEQAIGND